MKLSVTPQGWPFFYGWVIVAVSSIAIIASIPGQTIGVGVFTDFLISTLMIDRMSLTIAYGIGTIASSLCLPWAGIVLDRIGARPMVVLSSIGLGLSLVALAFVDTILVGFLRLFRIGTEHFSYEPVIIAGTALFFFALRFSGQGCLVITARYSIGKWFNKRRGLATMISGIFIAIGFNFAPWVMNALITLTSWWQSLLVYAVAIGIGMSALGWIFFRDNPEEVGLRMDGDYVSEKKIHHDLVIHHEFTRAEALRTSCFWLYALAFSCHAMLATAFGFHVSDIGAELGLDRTQAYSIYLPMLIFGIPSTILSGLLSDRMPLRYILIVFCLSQFMATWGAIFFSDDFGWLMIVIGFGFGNGIFVNLITLVFPRFFGRKHLGAISGFNTSAIVFASATGPFVFSTLKNLFHSYSMVMELFLLFPGILLVWAFFIKNPQHLLAEKRNPSKQA